MFAFILGVTKHSKDLFLFPFHMSDDLKMKQIMILYRKCDQDIFRFAIVYTSLQHCRFKVYKHHDVLLDSNPGFYYRL